MSDLRTLRELAAALLRYDCVTFLTLLDTLRLSEGRASVWLLHAAAHTIFEEVCSSGHETLHAVVILKLWIVILKPWIVHLGREGAGARRWRHRAELRKRGAED